MKKYFETLRHCSLFDNISDDNLIALLGCLGAKTATYNKNEIIISEGDSTHYFGIVLSGAVQLSQNDLFGNRSIISKISTAQLFGEAFVCAETETIPMDITASEPCEIMFIDYRRIIHTCCNACEFHTQIIYNMMKNIALKNIHFYQKLQITAKRTTREKLMEYLMQQAKNAGSNAFEIPFDRQSLADYLEVDRSGLSAEISKLRKEGILINHKNHFEIL